MNLEEKVKQAVAYLNIVLPHLAPTLAKLDIRFDSRVETAAICESGRVLLSPVFAEALGMKGLGFVIAHELYHVLYRVFDRFSPSMDSETKWLVNIAHDFIINDLLIAHLCTGDIDDQLERYCEYSGCDSFWYKVYIPTDILLWENFSRDYYNATGKDQPPLSDYTLESLVLELRRIKDILPKEDPFLREVTPDLGTGDGETSPTHPNILGTIEVLLSGTPEGKAVFGEKLDEFIDADTERSLFPDDSELSRIERPTALRQILHPEDVYNIRKLFGPSSFSCGYEEGRGESIVEAIADRYVTPWEAALQKWIDDSAPKTRSWAKASRRTGGSTDAVFPGRQRDSGFTLNIVIDTSGSMTEELGRILGMIQSFGTAAGVEHVRIIQCDTAVYADDIVAIDELSHFTIKGFGGSDMSAGLLRFAEDPSVESVLVLTDGYIAYPPEGSIPFAVTWGVLLDRSFSPPYGNVIMIR